MDTTRVSLLARVRNPQDAAAWHEFNRIYFPLIFRYARARGLSRADADDIAQECMVSINRHLVGFVHDRRKGTFKRWLRTMVNRKVIDLFRRRRPALPGSAVLNRLIEVEDEGRSLWERQWEKEHLMYCLERVREEVAERTYEAFVQYALMDRPPADIAGELGMTVNQLYNIKLRVRKRLGELMAEHFGDEAAEY